MRNDKMPSTYVEVFMDSKQTWIIAGIIALVVGACLCIIIVLILGGAGLALRHFVFLSPTETVTTIPTLTPILTPTTTTAEATTTASIQETPTPTEILEIDLEILEQMEEIEDQVVELRGLQPTGPVERTLLTSEDLHQRVLNDFLADYTPEEARDDARLLSLLGLLDADFDLLNFYTELYNEQVAGYYDDEIKQMFVVQGEGFKGPERLTYSHEYTHALQDQTYDFNQGLNFNEDSCEEDSERCAALQAVIEGDATLLEEQWLRNFATAQDYREILEFLGNFESPVYDSAPGFMQEDFVFPYTYGTDFVRETHLNGGWAAVDMLYTDPPLSTEQILHPERYPEDEPIMLDPPDLTATLGEGWREMENNVLGEWYTRLVLSEYLDLDLAINSAEGWGGDYYVALFHDGRDVGAFILMTVWDKVKDAEEFYLAFEDYGERRFGEGTLSTLQATWSSNEGSTLIERWGNQTLWVLAPSSAELESLRQAIEFPLTSP
jgi:hypothetical protein